MQDINIVFFPHAGGNASIYKCFSNTLKRMGYNSRVAEYPGHGMKIVENLISDMNALVDYLYEKLFQDERDYDYIFFGHSMGSWVAYELCRKMRDVGRKTPMLLFVSGNTHPLLRKDSLKYTSKNDDEFIKDVLACGGTSPEVFANRELRALFLPVLRNDYLLLETYTSTEEISDFKVDSDIIAMGGKQDRTVGRKLDTWGNYTKKDFQMYYFKGQHFYLFDHVEKISEIISEQIMMHMDE